MKTSHPIVGTALLALWLAAASSGCAVSREMGPGRPLAAYDYLVVSREGTTEYFDRASSMLGESFVVLQENDQRLELPRVRNDACLVSVGWSPGFWSTSGWVTLKDYNHGTHVHTSFMRRGMVWTGANADVLEALRDVAAARAAGGPLREDARNPVPEAVQARSTADRLQELNDLKLQGLITEKEYSARRQSILSQH